MQSPRPALIAVIALSAAACNSDRGLAIEVAVGNTGATSVALYVGNRPCADNDGSGVNCDAGIAPPGGGPHLPGKIWFRQDPVPYEAPVVDGKATFRFEASKTTTLQLVVAIGTIVGPIPAAGMLVPAVGTATMTAVEVPADTARVATVTLVKAAADGTATPDQAVQAVAWSTLMADKSCLAIARLQDNKLVRTFIVPAEDPDCDAVKPECDPQAANALNNGSDPKPACYFAAPDAADQACRLGAFSCTDAMPNGDTCSSISPTETCIPEAFCSCMGRTPDQGCAQGQLAMNIDNIPHVECTIQVAPLTFDACPDPRTEIDLKGHLGNACGQPLLMSSLRLADFPGALSAHFGNLSLDLQLTTPDPSCHFRLQVNSGGHTPGVDDVGMINVSSKTGSVLVPVIFKFELLAEPKCTNDVKNDCTLIDPGNDAMWGCLE